MPNQNKIVDRSRTGPVRRFVARSAVLSLVMSLLVGVSPAAAAGTLSGTVTGDGAGLENVTIELALAGDTTVVSTATTDASGDYILTPDAGTYDLTARPPAGSSFGPSTVTGVQVVDGETRNVDVVLVTVGGLPPVGGTVSVDGEPTVGASIRVREPRTSTGVETTTDATGAWTAVPTSRTGILDVFADGECISPSASLPERWSLLTSYDVDATTTYDVTPSFVRVGVTVVTADGDPVAGARVESFAEVPQNTAAPLGPRVAAINLQDTGCPENLTDVFGGASLVTVPGGLTRIDVYPTDGSGRIERRVQVDPETTEVTVALPPPPVIVSGTVPAWDGQPAPGVAIELTEDGTNDDVEVARTDSDGSFAFTAVPGEYELALVGGEPADVGPNFRATRSLTIPPGVDLELGTWQPPLAGVDLRVTLADTGEEVQVAVRQSGLRASLAADVFGAAGTVSGGGIGFLTNTAADDRGASVMLAGTPYTLVPNSSSSLTVPVGYRWPDAGWVVTPGDIGTETTAQLTLELQQTTTITGRVLQGGVPVEGHTVAVVGEGFVRTDDRGTFSLPSPVGTVDISTGTSSSDVGAPNFNTGRLRNLTVPPAGLDLGDLELPWVPLDVRVLVPDGEDPVLVEMDTTTADAFLDAGWGFMSWRGGYLAPRDTEELRADGAANQLWFTPSSDRLRFRFTPVDPDSPYEQVELFRTVEQGGDTLQVQLQRAVDPGDLPPTISGVTPRSVGESAPNVLLSVGAVDPEGETVTITWDVLGITPAPTGARVDLGPLDGPLSFDAVATACDPALNCASFTIEVEIRDEPPVLSADLPATVAVGDTATLTASATDVRDDVTITVDWGDGSSETVTGGSAPHVWDAAGTYDVTVSAVTDDATTTQMLPITVEAPLPAPPVASVESPVTVTAGEQVVLDASGSTGTGPSFAWTAVTGGSLDVADVAGPTYTAGDVAGEFSATVTVTDEVGQSDSATVAITVVAPPPEPPTASDGFITGGGWVGDGPGAGREGGSFGFVVRSRDGEVTGSLTARLHGARLRVVADVLDGFALDGSTVTFSGTATVNGTEGYRVTVVTTDGGRGRGVDEFHLTVIAPDGSVVATTEGSTRVRGQIVLRSLMPPGRVR